MGQRTVAAPQIIADTGHKATLGDVSPAKLSVFSTEIGWCGLLGANTRVERLSMGHPSQDDVRQTVRRLWAEEHDDIADEIEEANWYPELRERLQNYFQGAVVDFRDVKLNLPRLTAFQSRVIGALKQIGYGELITYGELAAKAGAPRAARAVGTVMSSNRIPVLIPCHRVIASGGKLGGFSAPQGTSLKQHLLTMESEAQQ
ncbi:methylated-DNA--[protein]-cysteine S-methyltransferase [Gimesia fumaroli]|jgi:methylated-DNA-[protein]-cysteine S-methyltransferase|uniref:methylated-DNA--[protein]-cysteine S-methyltransferase n=1 Tax=Gimesia fumaroli TaxID=2527976 RepID=A0A518IJ92_9PLAN|nr:methylated-DNA--[protein]-cysteine S-methyltransferase [Gimesia fumaroli]QDV53162.1 Methylated-DNA--protein-cysteine methyltransferase [Gimesia fumaroli]